MLISGINAEFTLPPYDEYIEDERKKEEERCQKLKLKMEEAINNNFYGKKLIEIQSYKEVIFSYLKDNGKYDLIDNMSALIIFINTYYKVLRKENVSLNDYVLLQSLSRTLENEITVVLEAEFEKYKDILVSIATQKCIEQGGSSFDNDAINIIIKELLQDFENDTLEETEINPIYEKYKTSQESVKNIICQTYGVGSFEDLKFTDGQIRNVIKNMLLINSKTGLIFNPYLKSKQLKIKMG